jgi:hypothetical protein
VVNVKLDRARNAIDAGHGDVLRSALDFDLNMHLHWRADALVAVNPRPPAVIKQHFPRLSFLFRCELMEHSEGLQGCRVGWRKDAPAKAALAIIPTVLVPVRDGHGRGRQQCTSAPASRVSGIVTTAISLANRPLRSRNCSLEMALTPCLLSLPGSA